MSKVMGYYRCKSKTERNAAFPIHVLVSPFTDWPESVLVQRGLNGNRRLTRPMTEEEIRGHEENARATSYKYRTLQGLIEDEERCGSGPEFLEALREAFADV